MAAVSSPSLQYLNVKRSLPRPREASSELPRVATLSEAEYQRLQQPPLDLRDKKLVDAFRLWQQCEPRSLQHAHVRFVGDSFESAHSAAADVAATGRVLRGMLDAFGLSGRDWDSIADVCEPERASWVGPSRHIRWTQTGTVVVGFGRHGGTPVHMLANSPDRDYLMWILDKDFPPHVHAICRRALDMPLPAFRDWVRRVFGVPHFVQVHAAKNKASPAPV